MPTDRFGRFVKALQIRERAGESFHLTVNTGPLGACSFSRDNWDHLDGFAQDLSSRTRRGDVIVVIVRRFEAWDGPADPSRPKSVWAYRIQGDEIVGLGAEQMRAASSYHAVTGAPLDPEPGVIYVDAASAMPEVSCSEAGFHTARGTIPHPRSPRTRSRPRLRVVR